MGAESRRAFGKITDPEQLRTRLATFDPTHLVVGTSVVDPDEAAARIAAML